MDIWNRDRAGGMPNDTRASQLEKISSKGIHKSMFPHINTTMHYGRNMRPSSLPGRTHPLLAKSPRDEFIKSTAQTFLRRG
jgi:hypothetical protein